MKDNEFSVSEILQELQGETGGKIKGKYSVDDILAEFGSSPAETTPKPEPSPVLVQEPVSVPVQEKSPVLEPVSMPEPIKKEKRVKQERKRAPQKPKQVYQPEPVSEPEQKVKVKVEKTIDTDTFAELFGHEKEEQKEKPKRRKREAAPAVHGPSVLPHEYVTLRKGAVRMRGLCAIFLFLLSLALCYLSFAVQLHLFIPAEITFTNGRELYHLIALGLSVLVILVGLPVILEGARQIGQMRLGMEAAISFAMLANVAHLLTNLLLGRADAKEPYAAIVALALFFAVYGQWLRDRSRLRACKAAGQSQEPMGIFSKDWYQYSNIIKQPVQDQTSFARHIEDPDGAAQFWTYLAPIVIVASLVVAGCAGIKARDVDRFFWVLAAVSATITPFFGMLSYALPFAKLTKHLSGIGSAIAGWFAVEELAGKQNLIIRDSDLFPNGTTSIYGIRLLGDYSMEQTLSYVTSVFKESNNGLYPLFDAQLRSAFAKAVPVQNLRHYESGGVEADLLGNHVLVGNAAFLIRMGVRLGDESDVKNAVFIAINSQAAGVFHIKYKIHPEVRGVLAEAIRCKITPFLAVVDFNLTPMMVETTFDLPSGSLEYPNIEDRLDLAVDTRFLDQDACAFVTRSGFVPFVSCVLAAKRLRKITNRNVAFTTICVFIGMMLMLALTWMGKANAATPYNLLWYQLFWMLPAFLTTMRVEH